MEFKFTVQTKIKKPIDEVFQAVVDNNKLTQYFVERSSAPLQEGQTVTWGWANYGDFPVTVQQVVPNEKVVFEWDSHHEESPGENKTQVVFDFETLEDGSTLVKVTEGSWQENEKGLKKSYDNCSGWQEMLLCLKAYLEHSIDLRGSF